MKLDREAGKLLAGMAHSAVGYRVADSRTRSLVALVDLQAGVGASWTPFVRAQSWNHGLARKRRF